MSEFRDGQTDRQTDTRRVRPAKGREVLIPCRDAGCMVLPERCHGACQREDISRSVSSGLGAGIKIATLFLVSFVLHIPPAAFVGAEFGKEGL